MLKIARIPDAYKLSNRLSVKHNPQDKRWWLYEGIRREKEFVENIAVRAGLDIGINPDKNSDPTTYDLVIKNKDGLFPADLKSVTSPFFRAKELYDGFSPDNTVTFNLKDFQRYVSLYPGITVLFWVNWLVLSAQIAGKTYSVNPKNGVWMATIEELKTLVDNGAPIHVYNHRSGSDRNATSSYMIDLNKIMCIWESD